SKNQFHRELDDAIIAGRQSVGPADVVGDLSKVRSSDINKRASLAPVRHNTRSEGIQMVENVKGFRRKLNRLAFLEFEVPRQGHIQLKDTRSLHVVTAEIAIRTELIPLQGVSFEGKGIAGVQVSIAHEFEQIAVKIVSAGFGDRLDGCRRVESI